MPHTPAGAPRHPRRLRSLRGPAPRPERSRPLSPHPPARTHAPSFYPHRRQRPRGAHTLRAMRPQPGDPLLTQGGPRFREPTRALSFTSLPLPTHAHFFQVRTVPPRLSRKGMRTWGQKACRREGEPFQAWQGQAGSHCCRLLPGCTANIFGEGTCQKATQTTSRDPDCWGATEQ